MAKRFKLRVCRVINTTLQSCRSKDPSNLPTDPVPSFSHATSKFSPLHFPAAPKHGLTNHHPSIHRRVSSAFLSIGCDQHSTILPSNPDHTESHSPEFSWEKEEKWHVITNTETRRKIYNSSASEDDQTFAPPEAAAAVVKKKKLVKNKKKKLKNVPTRLRLSTSSTDSGWFSSDGGGAADEEETETLFSTDSSSEKLHPIKETQILTTTTLPHRRNGNPNKRRPTKRVGSGGGVITPPPPHTAAEEETPARLSVFKKLIPCTVDGKVKESFAIVKRSSDPYEDFKNSMMDMILEKQMFEREDLEQLLQCFLSLNSRRYHGVIVQAFSEIWEAIFFPN